MVEKTVDAKAKTSLLLPPGTKKIDSKYPKNYKLLAKRDKNKTN